MEFSIIKMRIFWSTKVIIEVYFLHAKWCWYTLSVFFSCCLADESNSCSVRIRLISTVAGKELRLHTSGGTRYKSNDGFWTAIDHNQLDIRHGFASSAIEPVKIYRLTITMTGRQWFLVSCCLLYLKKGLFETNDCNLLFIFLPTQPHRHTHTHTDRHIHTFIYIYIYIYISKSDFAHNYRLYLLVCVHMRACYFRSFLLVIRR